MNRLLILLFALLMSSTSYAANDPENGDPKGEKPFTARLFQSGEVNDRWFIGANAGGSVYFGDHDKQLDFGKRIAPKFELYVGKWLNEAFGARVSVGGFQFKGVTQTDNLSTGEVWDASQRLKHQKFNYLAVHAELMFNWLNDVYGYNPERIYSVIPYAGFGAMIGLDHTKAKRFSPTLGVLQTFRLSNKFDINIDVRGIIQGDGFDGEYGGRNFEGSLSGLLGLNYKFR